jgi:ComF family protein
MEEKMPASEVQLCSDCKEWDRAFDKGFTCVSYGLLEKSLIYQLKYKDKSYLSHYMATLMYERISIEDIKPDLAVPIPMYKRKEGRRGYNQAELLSRQIAKQLNIPSYPNLLVRKSDTKPMSGLGIGERRENVQDVFYAKKWVQNIINKKTILLVDDIFTTGSTTEACAMVLKEAGAHKVYVLTFAAGADVSRAR